jgi:hypothetical protein
MTDSRKENLEHLMDILIDALVEKVKSGEATAADLQAARQLLKDNNIDINKQKPPAGIKALQSLLPEMDPDELPPPFKN